MYKRNNGGSSKGTFSLILFDEEKDKEIKLSVYPPKMKVLKKIRELDADDNKAEFDIIETMTDILSDALSRNKEKIKLESSYLEELLDVEDVEEIFEDYFEWVAQIKKK